MHEPQCHMTDRTHGACFCWARLVMKRWHAWVSGVSPSVCVTLVPGCFLVSLLRVEARRVRCFIPERENTPFSINYAL